MMNIWSCHSLSCLVAALCLVACDAPSDANGGSARADACIDENDAGDDDTETADDLCGQTPVAVAARAEEDEGDEDEAEGEEDEAEGDEGEEDEDEGEEEDEDEGEEDEEEDEEGEEDEDEEGEEDEEEPGQR